MNARTGADILRSKYMAAQLKKTTLEKAHPDMTGLYGIDYLSAEIKAKLYNPLFNTQKYIELGATAPKAILIRGISGVGKSYIISCFCQHFKVDLITGYTETSKDIRELFSKSKASERSVVMIECAEMIMKEDALLYQLNSCIKAMDWNGLVVISHTDSVDKLRYDGEIFVKIPSVFERREILDGLLKGMRTEGIKTLEIAEKTPGFVARDIVKLLGMVATRAVSREEDGMAHQSILGQSRQEGPVITMDDFAGCIREWKSITQNVTFDDIGALNRVKEELRMSILLPSRYPERFASFGISKPSGVLLHGPPGCGKTLIAKAVSNMSHCNFLSIKGPELITKYVGDSEKHLRDLFQRAKNLSPCVLFFDEIDSLCGRRGKNEFGNRIVNQILTLLDGMEDRGEVYLIGATNRIDSLDEALMRPGRFDKIIEVALPDERECVEIFRKCIVNVPCEGFDHEGLGLSGFSGADIAGIVKEAAITCLRDHFDSEDVKITREYFRSAIEKMRGMRRPKKRVRG